ncbi:uncharacterized protein TNCV_4736801 [Trichonephila clavipes]|nr:uncharacterized protein TNCV_4736801 [Trichonephila clavipes]
MTHTSNERVNETVLFAGMCARNFVVNLQTITTFLGDISSLKQLAVLVKGKVRGGHDCNWYSTVTGSVYLDALQIWLFPQLEESEPNNFIWPQHGEPPHWHLSVRDWLNITEPNQCGLAAKSLPMKLASHGLHVHPVLRHVTFICGGS